MSLVYTPQLSRVRSTPGTPCMTNSPSTPRRQYSERLIPNDCSSDGGSTFYTSPAHHHGSSYYGTLCTEQSKRMHMHVLEMSTPSTSSSEADTAVLKMTLNRPVAWMWMISNVLVLGNFIFTFLQPNWLENEETGSSAGMITFCNGTQNQVIEYDRCKYFEQITQLQLGKTSVEWQICLVLFAIGCGTLGVGGVLTIIHLCVPGSTAKERVSFIAGYLQLLASMFHSHHHINVALEAHSIVHNQQSSRTLLLIRCRL